MSESSVEYLNNLFQPDHVDQKDDFYFETDFLALKGNRDYLKLIKTLAILDAQRIKVSQDIDRLEELKSKVDIDLDGAKRELLETKPDYLNRINIAAIPEINWSKYKRELNTKELKTRKKCQNVSDDDVKDIKQEDDKKIRVRGRVYDEKKPETFNQLWTAEEQLRLEQLLVEFPAERVENRRWKKIAEALGNRTTKQVCSRVQKYFKKLSKAGLVSRSYSFGRAKPAHVHRKNKHFLYKPSTFFPAAGEIDSESDEDTSLSNESNEANLSYWKGVLEKIVQEKQNDCDNPVQHFGYVCKFCGENPILGTRWMCVFCPEFNSCSDCLATVVDKEPPVHSLSHRFNPIYEFVNPYYTSQALGSNNYLDPNFVNNLM